MSRNKKSQFQRFIIDSIPVAMVTMDYDFKITSFNKRAEKLTGYKAHEAIGQPCHDILNSSRCQEGCPLQTVQNFSESTLGLEGEVINRNGEKIPVRIGAASIVNNDNNFTGYLEVIEDISRQKRIEREKNNFIFMIAHDMKSPLIGINGLINRLKKEKSCQENDKLQSYFKVIEEAGQRLESMVSEFLEYSRLENGQIKLELRETDIAHVLQQATDMHRLRAEERNIVLSCNGHSLTAIEADENRLHRVFSNIIDNAIKYSPRQTEISISTRETESEILIYFKDQGWGIGPQEIPYIFDAFYRTKSDEKPSGQGLGLAASRAIISQHGGTISVESIQGKGSVFTVRLPKHGKAETKMISGL
ncbi:MAG: PAS domain-containing sensor histidine kinase [Desulfobulbaceae bacterium]|nr:PAS domain-containing sensor histidine kinase [Desulfobulbaceae bacterium]